MAITDDPKLLEIAYDVTCRFMAHDTYGSKDRAIKALRKRAPGFTLGEYDAVFDCLCNVYDRAAAAIPKHLADRPEKTSKFAEFEDVDFVACLSELDEIEPGAAMNEKHRMLNWCIFWLYLK